MEREKMTMDSEKLFSDFCRAVEPQLRTPFIQRNADRGLEESLRGAYRVAGKRAEDEIIVDIEMIGDEHYTLRTCMRDQSFIVDTTRLLVETFGGRWESGFNVILRATRDENGELVSVGGEGYPLDSLLQIEIDGISEDQLELFEGQLRRNLKLARGMALDFEEMLTTLDSIAESFDRMALREPEKAEQHREAAAFLKWLATDNFIFMGIKTGTTKLGFETDESQALFPTETSQHWPAAAWGGLPIRVRKSGIESPVHRSGRIDEILVSVPGLEGGNAVLISGMFTYRAITVPSRHVPVLRRLLEEVLEADHAIPGSWRYKGLANAFDSLPSEFLFTASREQVEGVISRILDAEAERSARVHLSIEEESSKGFALVAMPKCQYSEGVIRSIERELKAATGATYLDQGAFVGRYGTVLVHFFLTGVSPLGEEVEAALRETIITHATPWARLVEFAIAEAHGCELAEQLHSRYRTAFEPLFMQRVPAERAAEDILIIERLDEREGLMADLFVDNRGRLTLRLFQLRNAPLSDLLPVLDNFGLKVQDQFSDFVAPLDGADVTIDSFRLIGDAGEAIARKGEIVDALEAVFEGHIEDDQLNRLVYSVGLPWQEVDLIRAHLGYARQRGVIYGKARCADILTAHPELVKGLVELFHAKFNPERDSGRKKAIETATGVIEDGLRLVRDHDEDRLFRAIFEQLQASTRTNFFRTDRVEHYISFKMDHKLLPSEVDSGLRFEIYVHHALVEGCHLRGGKVARGGLRWSDREDFRIEVLGLVRTQMVKNVLIVPVGAKGGFRLKQTIPDWATRRAAADTLYKIFIRGLLDVTCNYVGGKILSPKNVVIHDEKDPYLVVAADKGTAHLSDTANALSIEYGHWLGDAFASGGSHGYDHKVVGITARGGWECVRRHFAEMGLDPRSDEFTCVGIGDPAGDVFGNGVVEHSTMRLIAAFNHKHIFVDPNPDAKVSYKERERLFRNCQGWEHYNTDLISEGGGVFERSAKTIPVSEELGKILGVLKTELPPDTVIRLLIRAQVDLFWNGGIGTYVKASWETNRDADDAANDNLRVNGNELRCRVVGEGGNLGFTHAGRVEFAQNGGRLNNDATDNSGGVDMSDHEVNLKILLAERSRRGS